LDCDTILCGGLKPFLTFDFILVSHQFNPTLYFIENEDRKEIKEKVWELYNLRWGYTKIHHYLKKNKYDVGNSRTFVDSIIKKMKKRDGNKKFE
tara:strand:+ start:357 stop:638 length:282 start_codon:yes stop_codon:yes gene_type:complete